MTSTFFPYKPNYFPFLSQWHIHFFQAAAYLAKLLGMKPYYSACHTTNIAFEEGAHLTIVLDNKSEDKKYNGQS